MEHFINYVDIFNFKSINQLRLEDCRRINIFLGYPNVGKSNVLEALSLFSIPFLEKGENLNRLVRVENAVELFHISSAQNTCSIDTNLKEIVLYLSAPILNIHHGERSGMSYAFLEDLNVFDIGQHSTVDEEIKWYNESNIKRYTFNPNNKWKSNGRSQLLPPFGENIIDVLSFNQNITDVKDFIKKEFEKCGLQLVLNKKDNSILVQRNVNKDMVLQLPYSSIADTLQRIIFYKTAIASNQNSILLFEEPEANAFPPYIKTITRDIIDAKTNQFFIVTHSPYIVTDFLEYEDLRKEVAIYLFDYKNDQTTVKRLTDEEMDEIYNFDVDLFFNIERYLRDE